VSLRYLFRFASGALLLLLRQLLIFAAAAARPLPTPPPFLGGGKYQKRKSPVASGLACCHACVGLGLVSGALGASWLCYNLI